jgi:hypothetical protein
VEVTGIIGTSAGTVGEARSILWNRYGLTPRVFTSVEVALDEIRPDIVVISSPYEFHREQLREVARLGVHCLCEKPLWYPINDASDTAVELRSLLNEFSHHGCLLDTVHQWPFTLSAFRRLHGERREEQVKRFDMRLSPISIGSRMVPDAFPHVWSMLYALVGRGEVLDPLARFNDCSRRDLQIKFRYRHAKGDTSVRCKLITTECAPRVAGYAINGRWVSRRIEQPGYRLWFDSVDRSVQVKDPLVMLVADFVRRVRASDCTDSIRLVSSMDALATISAAIATQ